MESTFRSPFSYGISNSSKRLPRNGLLIYLARPNSDEYLVGEDTEIGEDTYIWGYVLPDDADVRDATGWVNGTANVFYTATGVPIVALATEIAAAILPANVVFSLVDATTQTGKLAIYTATTTEATLDKARSVLRDESINRLFYGVDGIWYDPQDLTTLYQDAAGTLPVYRPGTGLVDPPVGLMLDKSRGLELGPELVVNGDFSNGTNGWFAASTGGSAAIVEGGLEITPTVVGAVQGFGTPISCVAGRWYCLTVNLKFAVNNQRYMHVSISTNPTHYIFARLNSAFLSGENTYYFRATQTTHYIFFSVYTTGDRIIVDDVSCREIKGYHAGQPTTLARPPLSGRYNLLTATETLSTQSVTTVATNYTLRFEGTGSITLSGTATGTYSAGTHTITCTGGTLTCTVSGSVTKADLRVKRDGSSLPAYQAVTNANTYDTAGFPLYLRRDRVDDDLIVQAPTINGVSAWGAAEGSLFGKVNIAAGEYKPLGVITEGLTTCTQRIAVGGTLSAAETAVLERLVASKSGTTYDVTTADPVVFQFNLTSVSTFNFTLQTKSGLPVLVDWGDGNTTAYAGTTDQTATKTYAASGNYTVKVYAEDDSVLTKFSTAATGMSGTLSLPSGMTYFNCSGSNTLSGTLSLPSGMTYFLCAGSNTLSGTLSLPSEMTFFDCGGSNTLSGYTPSAKASNQERFIITGQNTLSATDVDNILIDYDAAGGEWTGAKEITIQGNAANRTSASDAAYASLATKLTTLSVD